MPDLVRERLYLGNIKDAADILQHGSDEITHVLSILSSSSISAFTEWRSDVVIPSKDTRKVCISGRGTGNVEYLLENAGKDFKFVRMAVALGDIESENLLDYFGVCLDFIEGGRKEGGCVLVHCFAGISRSATVITAYLMRSERLSARNALESLRQRRDCVYPNAGFREQLREFEDMGFVVDRDSSGRLGKVPMYCYSAVAVAVVSFFCCFLLAYRR